MSRAFDLLISGGEVVDGSAGAVAVRADVGVTDGVIAAVGDLAGASAATVVDATGRAVVPGFIDAHVHSEHALVHGADEDRSGSLIQGVTTHTTGADGFGWVPVPAGDPRRDPGSLWRSTCFAYGDPDLRPDRLTVDAYLGMFPGASPVNVAPLAPHQAIRFGVMGWETRAPDPTETAAMVRALEAWLYAGALGLSTGLDYQPASSTSTEEIIGLARVVAAAGGVYLPHQRYRQRGRVGAWQESIRIGREAGIPVAISHEQVDDVTRPLIDGATDVDLTFDWYAYPAGSTHLLATLPTEDYAGGTDGVLERLHDPAERRRLGAIIERSLLEPEEPGSFAYFSATRTGRYIGRTIPDLAAEQGVSVAEMAVRLLEEELPSALLVYRRGVSAADHAAEVRDSALDPRWTLASDGIYHGERPHPRGFGCFVRHLRVMRETGTLPFGEAVHRMSGAVADRLHIADRGRVREGLAADLVVLDPATVCDRATWEEPRLAPVGIDTVLVNGVIAVAEGRATGALAGRLVRRRGG